MLTWGHRCTEHSIFLCKWLIEAINCSAAVIRKWMPQSQGHVWCKRDCVIFFPSGIFFIPKPAFYVRNAKRIFMAFILYSYVGCLECSQLVLVLFKFLPYPTWQKSHEHVSEILFQKGTSSAFTLLERSRCVFWKSIIWHAFLYYYLYWNSSVFSHSDLADLLALLAYWRHFCDRILM